MIHSRDFFHMKLCYVTFLWKLYKSSGSAGVWENKPVEKLSGDVEKEISK